MVPKARGWASLVSLLLPWHPHTPGLHPHPWSQEGSGSLLSPITMERMKLQLPEPKTRIPSPISSPGADPGQGLWISEVFSPQPAPSEAAAAAAPEESLPRNLINTSNRGRSVPSIASPALFIRNYLLNSEQTSRGSEGFMESSGASGIRCSGGSGLHQPGALVPFIIKCSVP